MKLDSLANISETHLEIIKDNDAPSRLVKSGHYDFLILRFLTRTKDGLTNYNAKFLYTDSKWYLIEDDNLDELKAGVQEVYEEVANHCEYQSSIIEHYADTVEILEDQIFDKNLSRSAITELFEFKRDVFKLMRNIERQLKTINDFVDYEKNLTESERNSFGDLQASLDYNQRLIRTQTEKLENLFSYYSSMKNDILNRNIYILSVISGIFLPLNLIVGFFGMNTTGLFLSHHQNGTLIVFYIILAIFFFLLVGFPLLHILDKYLFSKFFGRFSLYARLSHRLENISDEFNILKE